MNGLVDFSVRLVLFWVRHQIWPRVSLWFRSGIWNVGGIFYGESRHKSQFDSIWTNTGLFGL